MVGMGLAARVAPTLLGPWLDVELPGDRALDLEDGEKVRMHLGDEPSAIHLAVPGSADRSAVLMPVKQVESAR